MEQDIRDSCSTIILLLSSNYSIWVQSVVNQILGVVSCDFLTFTLINFCSSQNCTQLIQTIEDTGSIMREIRDLEEQVCELYFLQLVCCINCPITLLVLLL